MSELLIAWVLIFSPVDDSRIIFTVTTPTALECASIQAFVQEMPTLVLVKPCAVEATEVISL